MTGRRRQKRIYDVFAVPLNWLSFYVSTCIVISGGKEQFTVQKRWGRTWLVVPSAWKRKTDFRFCVGFRVMHCNDEKRNERDIPIKKDCQTFSLPFAITFRSFYVLLLIGKCVFSWTFPPEHLIPFFVVLISRIPLPVSKSGSRENESNDDNFLTKTQLPRWNFSLSALAIMERNQVRWDFLFFGRNVRSQSSTSNFISLLHPKCFKFLLANKTSGKGSGKKGQTAHYSYLAVSLF